MLRSNQFHLTGAELYWKENKNNLIEYASLSDDEKSFVDKFDMNQMLIPTIRSIG
jgi:hypothetical protein